MFILIYKKNVFFYRQRRRSTKVRKLLCLLHSGQLYQISPGTARKMCTHVHCTGYCVHMHKFKSFYVHMFIVHCPVSRLLCTHGVMYMLTRVAPDTESAGYPVLLDIRHQQNLLTFLIAISLLFCTWFWYMFCCNFICLLF